MASLGEDLQIKKSTLQDFYDVTYRVLSYLPDVISDTKNVRGYRIHTQVQGGTTKYARPIKDSLFISDPDEFEKLYNIFIDTIKELKPDHNVNDSTSYQIIDKIVYTIQQSIGVGLDLLVNPNSARKHVGNRFEELLRVILDEIKITSSKLVFQIPYETENGQEVYKCETDLIISPYDEIKSKFNSVDPNEIILSFKTSSKDRMGKIFLDKMLMSKFSGQNVRVAGIFLNDVQRKGKSNISFTFVPGVFLVYTKFLPKLEGTYFVDMPPKAIEKPYTDHVSAFSKFIINDIWELVKKPT